MQKNIALIYGDCSSPEIVTQAVRVLDKVAEKFGHTFTYTRAYMGGEAIDKFGDPLPQSELDKCLASDSVLLGAVGGPKWEGMAGDKRPEKGLLRLRAGMGLYANNRPARIWPPSRRRTCSQYRLSLKWYAPIASVAALTAQLLAALPPYGCGVPLAGSERHAGCQYLRHGFNGMRLPGLSLRGPNGAVAISQYRGG